MKLPEPVGYIRKDQLQKVEQGWAYLCDVGPEPRADKQPIYTESQLKQAVRDAYEDAAKVCESLKKKYRDAYKNRTQPVDGLYNPHTDGLLTGAWECETEIRALIKEVA